jgi:hypothetical protein
MDPRTNPFAPGAGTMPPELSGRQDLLDNFDVLLERLWTGLSAQSMIVTGLRGVGKTVLLNRFGQLAEERGWVVVEAEMAARADFAPLVARLSRKALLGIDSPKRWKDRAKRAAGAIKSFTYTFADGSTISMGGVELLEGMADTGDLGEDLTDIIVELGFAAKERGVGVVFLLDEVQFIDRGSFEAVILAFHKATQKNLPITMVAAGLPQIPKLSGDTKSYSERLFKFPRIGELEHTAAEDAIRVPLRAHGVAISDEALEMGLEFTGRYPYFLQEVGSAAWDLADDAIDTATMSAACDEVRNQLDSNFFSVRVARATDLELAYMRTMAELGDGPYGSGEVAKKLGYGGVQELGPIRAKLIDKGLIYTPDRGLVAFTVPLFADHLRRTTNFTPRS